MFTPFLGDTNEDGSVQLNYSLYTGDNINFAFQAIAAGVPINFTGYYGEMTILFPTPVVLNTPNSGIVFPSPTPTFGFITQSSAQTASWPVGKYRYDFRLISSGAGSPVVADNYSSGLIFVKQSVSAVP